MTKILLVMGSPLSDDQGEILCRYFRRALNKPIDQLLVCLGFTEAYNQMLKERPAAVALILDDGNHNLPAARLMSKIQADPTLEDCLVTTLYASELNESRYRKRQDFEEQPILVKAESPPDLPHKWEREQNEVLEDFVDRFTSYKHLLN